MRDLEGLFIMFYFMFGYWMVCCMIAFAAHVYEDKDGGWSIFGMCVVGLLIGWIIIPVAILMKLADDSK